jgi:hypothetical protein
VGWGEEGAALGVGAHVGNVLVAAIHKPIKGRHKIKRRKVKEFSGTTF